MLAYADGGDSVMHAVGLDPTSTDAIDLTKTVQTCEYTTYEGLYIHAGCSYNAQGTTSTSLTAFD